MKCQECENKKTSLYALFVNNKKVHEGWYCIFHASFMREEAGPNFKMVKIETDEEDCKKDGRQTC